MGNPRTAIPDFLSMRSGDKNRSGIQVLNNTFISYELTFSTVMDAKKQASQFIKDNENPRFDFASLQAADSSSLAFIFALQREAKRLDKPVQFENVPSHILDLAEVYGVKKFL